MYSDSEIDERTIGSETVASDNEEIEEEEDIDGALYTEDANRKLLSLLRAIREDDPILYKDPEFFKSDESAPPIDKSALFEDYFTSIDENEAKQKKKKIKEAEILEKKKIEKQKKEQNKLKKMITSKDSSDHFLNQFLLSNVWRQPMSETVNTLDETDKLDEEYEKLEEKQNELDLKALKEQEKRDLAQIEKLKGKKVVLDEDVSQYHFEEEGSNTVIAYPKFGKEEGSEREIPMSKRRRDKKTRNENFKKKLMTAEEHGAEMRKILEPQVIDDVKKVKEMIQGCGDVIDKLKLSSKPKEAFEQIESVAVYEHLVFGSLDTYSDLPAGDEIRDLIKGIRQKFEDYYGTFAEERTNDGDFRFHYKKVDKEDFGMKISDIIRYDDDELESVVPVTSIIAMDACGIPLDKKIIKTNLMRLRIQKLKKKKDESKVPQPKKFDPKVKHEAEKRKRLVHKRKRDEVEGKLKQIKEEKQKYLQQGGGKY